jgi:hypothetical protein
MGRRSTYTEELAREICERLSVGETLVSICNDAHMPARQTVSDWCIADADFAGQFARARDRGFDAIAADCLRIADETEVGIETTEKDDGSIETKRGDMLGHRKLRIETRLKLLAKWDPKRYGEKVTHASDAENPLIPKRSASDYTDAELAAIIAAAAVKRDA